MGYCFVFVILLNANCTKKRNRILRKHTEVNLNSICRFCNTVIGMIVSKQLFQECDTHTLWKTSRRMVSILKHLSWLDFMHNGGFLRYVFLCVSLW